MHRRKTVAVPKTVQENVGFSRRMTTMQSRDKPKTGRFLTTVMK